MIKLTGLIRSSQVNDLDLIFLLLFLKNTTITRVSFYTSEKKIGQTRDMT
jgi:aspartate carbamoyltransferase catalytic subunit